LTVLKSIVLGLALANVGYFLWARGIARSQAVPSTSMPNTLKLASEVSTPPADGDVAGAGAATSGVPFDDGVPHMPANVPANAPMNVKRCVTVGPFRDVSEAAHAASTLRGGGYDPRQRVIDGEVWAGEWVYVPVPATRPATDQLLAKLKAAGIDDALEMPGPVEGSVISLGLFNEQKRVQARVSQAQALGLTPSMTDRKHTGNQYWVDIDLKAGDGPLNPADLQGEAGRIQRLEVKACPAGAGAQP
jgi:hypothetical protein